MKLNQTISIQSQKNVSLNSNIKKVKYQKLKYDFSNPNNIL